ncbi:MAG: TIR domain-containing protein [Verrucomicrobiales bacterium]|nr:TIR domain-containing protein [Verrucomicrobiales bacterium]MCP5527023.1 TIR domain-containing protein [Verrucomicrobiales bacterium]
MASVFISYRHESDAHRARVREFAERLQAAGVRVVLDEFFLELHPGGPRQGWDRWSALQVKEASRIVIVASRGWFRCFEGIEHPGKGCGAACEARLIYTQLFDAKWESDIHRVVALTTDALVSLPDEIRHLPHFVLGERNPAAFQRLVSWLDAGEAAPRTPASPAVAWPAPLTRFQHGLADRQEREWPMIVALLSGQATKRVLLLEGEANHGKSFLIQSTYRYAVQAGICVARLDFKGGIRTVDDVLSALALEWAEVLPGFAAAPAENPHLLRRDMRALRRPTLLLLDTYERAAAYPDLADWIECQLLAEVLHAPALAAIVAGQHIPEITKVVWASQAEHLHLQPITNRAHWETWMAQRSPDLVRHLDTLLMLTGGVPGSMALNVQTIEAFQHDAAG